MKTDIGNAQLMVIGDCMRALVVALALAGLAGCAGTTNWEARVGNYSFDDAKREYGSPDGCARLDDQQSVCAWTLEFGRTYIDKLVLTFDKYGRLVSGGERRTE